jgi:hypothetical protein
MSQTYDNNLDDLTALVLYRSNTHWMSTHEEESAMFFKREDVQGIMQKIADVSKYNPSKELEKVLPKALNNALEKDMLRQLYAEGKIGMLKYQWEMLKRW